MVSDSLSALFPGALVDGSSGMPLDDPTKCELLNAARDMLAALWFRAMRNEATELEIAALQKGCVAIAIHDRGITRIGPDAEWSR